MRLASKGMALASKGLRKVCCQGVEGTSIVLLALREGSALKMHGSAF